MSDSNLLPFKAKKTFDLFNKKFEEGREYELHFIEVEVLISEDLVDLIPLNSVDYRKMLNEEKDSEKMLKLDENFFNFARISQKYLKEKSKLSEFDKKRYNDSASALRNFLRLRAEKILKLLLIENEKIEVHEEELMFIPSIGKEISRWIQFRESIIKGDRYEA
ncbi:MAG: hypothetical protein GKC01_05860 [Candidatus Methanofastidiosa archaeon]|nr:hypothetical protein [Candidatus Methanofastidiosa archaeon]